MKNISKNKRLFVLITGILGLFSVLFGVTYSFFNYSRTGAINTIEVGRIAFNHTQSSTITLNNILPIKASQIESKPNSVGTTVITITGDTEYSDGIEYLISIYDAHVTVNNKEIPVSLNITATNIGTSDADYFDNRGGNSNIYKILSNNQVDEGSNLLVGYIKSGQTGVNGSVTIKAFVDADRVIVTDTVENGPIVATGYTNLIGDDIIDGKTVFTTTEWNSMASTPISFRIKVEANQGIWVERGVDKVRKAITAKINAETNSCNPIWVDDMGTSNDTSDDVTYFSGTNDCVDMNYVWYSGKLWRITAIYPDGAIKLVTQNMITSIAFNEAGQVNFYTDSNTTSYMYQWLNEEFYDTLYNASDFIDTTKMWNATNASSISEISTRLPNTTMVSTNVGLLNSYEYYNSYRCVGSAACTGTSYSTGYLNIGYDWWLLNPYNASVWNVDSNGIDGPKSPANRHGGRPSIYLKSGLEFTGSGTTSSPYKIVGDKDIGNINELINTRLSGEYVKLVNNNSNQTFRIIGIEDNKTKIIAMDYADNDATKKFAISNSDTLWGSGTTTDTDTWYDYLNKVDNNDIDNTGFYDKLVKTYGELFDSATYYLGTSGYNYKLSVCANTTSGNTKVCDKTSQVGTFNIGLPRYGEMFATLQGTGYSNSIFMWLMNRYSTLYVWYVDYDGGYYDDSTRALGGRPTVHLKSTVKILSGSGTESDPYVVGL